MIDHGMYSEMLGAKTLGRARKYNADMIEDATFDGDIQYQVGYFYDYFHDVGEERFKLYNLHPQEDINKTSMDIKFIRHEKQSYNKDQTTFWLQFTTGQEHLPDYYEEAFGKKYDALWPVGLYVDIMDSNEIYNRWLVVNTANYWGDQFPTWELLKCDYLLQWIHNGKRYECPGVLQSQNSQICALHKGNLMSKIP